MSTFRAMATLLRRVGWRVSRDPVSRALSTVLSVEGQITPAEAKQLIELAGACAPSHAIVEIGTYRGRSASALACGARFGSGNRVHAIDPHLEFTGVLGGRFGPDDQAALYANLTRIGVGCQVAVISLPSTTVASTWPEADVGLLWIDGDHRYEGVLTDFQSWYPHVVTDGIIAFHDSPTPGVQQVIRDIVQRKLVVPVGEVDGMSWFKKTG
ncbi:MAG: class I SAM-dependent methyltransferase [bacterium]|nr:class I SAM-dependent methyltransferase [bacterium]